MHKNIILPNMITLLGLLCGMFSLVAVMNGRFFAGAVAILLAAVFDGLDGKVARLVKGTSEFGVQLDSLADVVSFGVAPAVLVYHWQFIPYKQLGMMAMFLFVACGALRLARFNVQTKKISNVFFVGLPIPAAAAMIASSVLFLHKLGYRDFEYLSVISLVMVFLLAFLMVSTVPYYSFKKIKIKMRAFNLIVLMVILLFFIGLEPQIGIFSAMALYLVSGFIMIPFRKRVIAAIEGPEKAQINEEDLDVE